MNKTTKYVLIGVGVLALVGIGLFASAQSRRRREEILDQQLQPQANVLDVATTVLDRISGNPEVAQQRIANRKLRQSTRQAKLLKRGKIKVEDLQKLKNI